MLVDPSSDPHTSERVASVLEWAAKSAISLASVKGFLWGIYRPFSTWRHNQMTQNIRHVLEPELAALNRILNSEELCANRMEEVLDQTRMIFKEFDDVLEVMMENRDRIDETNELLDSMGFSTERRHDERRKQVQEMVDRLHERRKLRQRGQLHGHQD